MQHTNLQDSNRAGDANRYRKLALKARDKQFEAATRDDAEYWGKEAEKMETEAARLDTAPAASSAQQEIWEHMLQTDKTEAGLVQLYNITMGSEPEVHIEPGSNPHVARDADAVDFITQVTKMHDMMRQEGRLDKKMSTIMEYATMSGAGKSRWGFEALRVLENTFKSSCTSRRIGFNFNGGTGEGASDRLCAETLFEKEKIAVPHIMAWLLLTRGLLQRSPTACGHFSNSKLLAWIGSLSPYVVIDALFTVLFDDDDAEKHCRLLLVHVDELGHLQLDKHNIPNDRALKDLVNVLAEYNCRDRSKVKGLVLPLVTHVAPLSWPPAPTVLPLLRMPLRPFDYESSLRFFEDVPGVESLQLQRHVRSLGGHADLLVECRNEMLKVMSTRRVKIHEDALSTISSEKCLQVVTTLLRQDRVALSDVAWTELFHKGLLFLVPAGPLQAQVSVPYVMFLSFLKRLHDPERFKDLAYRQYSTHAWSSKAFEVLCVLRVAADIPFFPFRESQSPQSALDSFRLSREPFVCLALRGDQEGVDFMAAHDGTLTLAQAKHQEVPGSMQDIDELWRFIEYVKQSELQWAQAANCANIHAMFITDRMPRTYHRQLPTKGKGKEMLPNDKYHQCFEEPEIVNGVTVRFTFYAGKAGVGTPAAQAIETWISPGLTCV